MDKNRSENELVRQAQLAAQRLGAALRLPPSVVADRDSLLFFFGAYGFRMDRDTCRRAGNTGLFGLDAQLLSRLLRCGVLVEVGRNPYIRACIGRAHDLSEIS